MARPPRRTGRGASTPSDDARSSPYANRQSRSDRHDRGERKERGSNYGRSEHPRHGRSGGDKPMWGGNRKPFVREDAEADTDENTRDPRFSRNRHYAGPRSRFADRARPSQGRPTLQDDRTPESTDPEPETKFRAKPNVGWQDVAHWYDSHLTEADTFHEQVLAPGLMEMIGGLPKGRALDVACGQGFFTRLLHTEGWQVTGVDIAPAMINAAREQSPRKIEYIVDNAEVLSKARRTYKLAICMMAVQNMEDGEKMIRRVSERLETGGTFVFTTLHPAFRIPQHSDWWFNEQRGHQSRIVHNYNTQREVKIWMNPSEEKKSAHTMTYHRPIAYYVNALANNNFAIESMGEWCSHKTSQAGPRARAENNARDEFPMFMAFKARKLNPLR